jgi:raffinose/stachyose/melibiose transport system substrate-binding protein
MKLRKQIFAILSALAIVAMLAACVATPPQTGAPAEGEQAATEGEAEATGDEQITLRWANIFDAASQEQWQTVIDAFEEQYPNITISSESTAGSGAAIYPDVLKTSMASGDPPDLFFMWGGTVAQPFIDAGQTLDLESYYEQYGWGDKFAPWVVERISSDGKLYGVPFHALGMGFWYRKDIFEELGIEVPTTFAEQEEVCATLKENDISCITLGGKFGWHTMRVLDYFLEHTCGPELHDQLNRLEVSWDQACVVEAYTIFQRWIDNGWVVPDFLNVEPNDARLPLFQGDAAIVLEGVWYEGVLKNDEQDEANFDFYLPPTDHEPLRFSAFPEQWMIPTEAAHPDEAALFIDFITRQDTQQQFPINAFANSATVGVNPDCNEWPLTCRWRDIILTAESTYPPTDQAFVKELMDGFFEVQDSIVAKRLTPEEGAALMQQRVEEWQANQ